MKIGVFDSGIGGRAVAIRLGELFPKAEIICVDDHAHVPYGNRRPKEIVRLTENAVQPLIEANCDVIVIACNTATAVAIAHLRVEYPHVNFAGIEPMVKPAAAKTKTGTIAVLATSATLASSSYRLLKEKWGKKTTILEPDTSTWATLIEAGKSEKIPVEHVIHELVEQGADVIALACTHYHWLKERAEKAAAGRATILEPSDAIGNRVISLVADNIIKDYLQQHKTVRRGRRSS